MVREFLSQMEEYFIGDSVKVHILLLKSVYVERETHLAEGKAEYERGEKMKYQKMDAGLHG